VTDEGSELDILGIGNAIVDVFSHVDDAFILGHGLHKGSMTLVDADRSEALYIDAGPAVELSGGSCANTMVVAASFGARVAYIGKVRDDQLGVSFADDARTAGLLFQTPFATSGPQTARCMVMVSPDGQRTMCTYLGASSGLSPRDIDEDLVARAKVTYLEGYLWDPPQAKEAFRVAVAAAHRAGRKVALTLSDSFCVERYREEFRDLAENHVDILLANEDEIRALYQVETLEQALDRLGGRCEIVAVTRSEKGSLVAYDGVYHEVRAEPVDQVVDTTGAGDAYAAGFLYGLTHGQDLPECARLGSIAAAEIISHIGARPLVNLAALSGRS
jgi:sugar/nucleoside kinase (ribokinase family)